MGLFRKKGRPEPAQDTDAAAEAMDVRESAPEQEPEGRRGKKGRGLFGRKKAGRQAEPEAMEAVEAQAGVAADQAGQAADGASQAPPPEEPDYYDWKARYRPWAGADMMGPALAGAVLLGFLVLVLLGFVFHPIW